MRDLSLQFSRFKPLNVSVRLASSLRSFSSRLHIWETANAHTPVIQPKIFRLDSRRRSVAAQTTEQNLTTVHGTSRTKFRFLPFPFYQGNPVTAAASHNRIKVPTQKATTTTNTHALLFLHQFMLLQPQQGRNPGRKILP